MSVRSFIVSSVIVGSSNQVGVSNPSLAAFDQLQRSERELRIRTWRPNLAALGRDVLFLRQHSMPLTVMFRRNRRTTASAPSKTIATRVASSSTKVGTTTSYRTTTSTISPTVASRSAPKLSKRR